MLSISFLSVLICRDKSRARSLPFWLSVMYSEPSGACATPSARAAACVRIHQLSVPAKPFAKTSNLPDGLSPANGWKVTL